MEKEINPFAVFRKAEEPEPSNVAETPVMRTAETLLRVSNLALSLVALLVMIKNKQGSDDFGILDYTDLGGFRYLVYANGLGAAYSLFSCLSVASPRCAAAFSYRNSALFFLDQVLTYLILAAGAVSAEIVYLAYNGDVKISWSQACGVYNVFCSKAVISVAVTFASALCYVILSLISSYRLFSGYEPPVSSSSKCVEVAAFPFSGEAAPISLN